MDAFVYDAVVLDYWAGKDANCELMMVSHHKNIEEKKTFNDLIPV